MPNQKDKPLRLVKNSLSLVIKLVNELKAKKYDMAIVFHAPWWISLVLFLAKIPVRAGVKSQWHSFLFLNRAVRQKRSDAEFSELEYNFQLVEKSLNLEIGSIGRQSLKLGTPTSPTLAKHKLEFKKYYVVHPGMGGSALNWPNHLYIDLIDKLVRLHQVVITGTATDTHFLEEIKKQFHSHPRVLFLDSELSGTELIEVLERSISVVAPSTGVLHLAASTETRAIGIFSPVQVQQPKRWGPQGSHTEVLVPKVTCPGKFACLGRQCSKYNCMDQIMVADVMSLI